MDLSSLLPCIRPVSAYGSHRIGARRSQSQNVRLLLTQLFQMACYGAFPKGQRVMSNSLKDTLNLPKTSFPMRASLASREPERLKRWADVDVYQKALEKNADGDLFILADGPPYANGNIHMGHALNKILKDLVIRYKTMRGYRAPYVPGWDCHGLPIEQQILKEIGGKIFEMEPIELRRKCADYAQKYVDIQREQFKRLEILGDWDRPYCTFNKDYEEGILKCLLELVRRDLVVRGHKAVHWDPVFRTALAEAEIEYHEHESPSIYVKFPLREWSSFGELKGVSAEKVSLVIWTTTPWTMPANLGVTLHPAFDYVALLHNGEAYIVAEGLSESFKSACGLEDAQVVARFKAGGFDRAECDHPIFPDKSSLVMLGEHVTLEQGTGCVHTAPGHGADDFQIGKEYGLPVFVPVDDRGCFTADFPEMEGAFVFKANPRIVELLDGKGLLLGHRMIKHDYPYSWRSKKPIIFRATEQWFMQLTEEGVRAKALEAIDHSVKWIPAWGRDRIRGMVERRPEWCLSRQRSWGVPIPSIRSRKSGDSILDARVIERVIEVVAEKGTDAWFTEPLSTFFPEGFVYDKTGESSPEDFEKEFDILDVWFDSGASHIASLEQDDRLRSPADLYLEGSDQHRGWFQAALLTSIGARDRAPFKAVLTHGFILDAQGRAMSKSMGNVISPLELIKTYGADILRLWVNSLDYTDDVSVGTEIMENVARAYRDIRNALRFQLGNLHDFDYERNGVSVSDMLPLDKWALAETAQLIERVTDAYERYEFHRAYGYITQYVTVTLSSLYHDILKDRLYTFGADWIERRSAQTVLYHSFDALTRLLAPVLCFTCDEARSFMRTDQEFSEPHIQLESWPVAPAEWKTPQAEDVERLLREVRPLVNEQLEALRRDKVIGKSIDAAVTLTGGGELMELLQNYEANLPELFIVSMVELRPGDGPVTASARHAPGERCPRSLRWVPELVETSFGRVSPRDAEALKSFNS